VCCHGGLDQGHDPPELLGCGQLAVVGRELDAADVDQLGAVGDRGVDGRDRLLQRVRRALVVERVGGPVDHRHHGDPVGEVELAGPDDAPGCDQVGQEESAHRVILGWRCVYLAGAAGLPSIGWERRSRFAVLVPACPDTVRPARSSATAV
jgi:hypothetical protein